MRPKTFLATSVAVIGLAAVGCGSDGDSNGGDDAAASSPAGASPARDDATSAAPFECVNGGSGDSTVSIIGFAFDPAATTVAIGASVTWSNDEPEADFVHSVLADETVAADGAEVPAFASVGADPDAAGADENLAPGDRATCTFAAAGTYEFFCGIHTSMRGTIVVEA